MANKYVHFIPDEHLLHCIANLHCAYLKAKKDASKKEFYKNKIDVFKLTFDSKFGGIEEVSLIEGEILRQVDKSFNNSIGVFHEEILGGIAGFEKGKNSGYDIKAIDNTLFADIKNKHNTMNSKSSEALFQILERYANDHKKANCYWVQVLAKASFHERWAETISGKEKSHSRVFKISGDQFYKLLTGEDDALFQLYQALPRAVDDYLKTIETGHLASGNSALAEIEKDAAASGRSIIDQIGSENFGYYLGFDRL